MNRNLEPFKMTPPQRREELERCLSLTVEGLSRAAVVWKVMRSERDDVSGIPRNVASILDKICAGTIAPRAASALIGSPPAYLRSIEGLDLELQQRLVSGKEIEVISPTEANATVQLPLTKIPPHLLPVVFQAGEIAEPRLQRLAWRKTNRPKKGADASEARVYKPRSINGFLHLGRAKCPKFDAIEAMRVPEPFDDGKENWSKIEIPIHKSRLKRLNELVDATGKTQKEILAAYVALI